MKTGVVGLGAMGGPMALNLHRAGKLTAIWNRTPENAEAIVSDTGLPLAGSLAELARQCELVIVSVSADEDVLSVIDALAPHLHLDSVVVDTSTVSIATAKEVAEWLSRRACHFLDAPVSGGVEGAKNGTLSMMIGGDVDILERVRPVLEVISSRIVHMGPVGNGQATKAVNQIMAAGINQAVTEALAFGQSQGLPMERVIEAVGSGAAGNWYLNHRGPTMIEGIFEPGFRLALHDKDLAICQDMAQQSGVSLPVVEATRTDYQRLIDEGHGDEDISALYRLKYDEADVFDDGQ